MDSQRSVVFSVIVSTFLVGVGGGVVFPILPKLRAVLGISPFLVGLILSADRFTRILANAPAGSLTDRLGTRVPFVVGLLIEGIATPGYVVALAAPIPEAWFLVARVLWDIGSALVFATAYTIAAGVSDSGTAGRTRVSSAVALPSTSPPASSWAASRATPTPSCWRFSSPAPASLSAPATAAPAAP